jgi:hypothetical protein
VIGDHFQRGLFTLVGFAQHGHDTEVGCPALHLQHGFIGDPLQQGVPELILNVSAVPPGERNLCFDPRLKRFCHRLRLLLQQRGKESRGERAPDTGGRLNDPVCAGTTIKTPRHLNQFAREVSDYAKGERKPLVIELRARSVAAGSDRPKAAARYIARPAPRPKTR